MKGSLCGFFIVLFILSPAWGQDWYEEWHRHFEGDSGSAYPFGIAEYPNGDIIVVGRTFNGMYHGRNDALIMKYTTDGDTLWQRVWQRPCAEQDTVNEGCADVLVDENDTAYVMVWTNYRIGAEYAATDITILKYDSDGNCIDTMHWDGIGDSDDMGNIMLRDPATGDIYVGGRRKQYDSGSIMDRWLVIKFNANLEEQWVHDMPALALMGAQVQDMILDGNGNLYATGYTSNPGTIYDYLTIKYDANGQILGQAMYDPGLGYQLDMATCLTLDPTGNVVVSGFINMSPGAQVDHDFCTIKYDADLDSLWVRQYTFSTHSDASADIICDGSGDVYLTGVVQLNQSDFDLWTMKYSADGDVLWTDRYSGPGFRNDAGGWIALDTTETELYVVGVSSEGPTQYDLDYLFLVYDPQTGDTLQSLKYNGTGNIEDRPQDVVLDQEGNIFVTGYTIEVLDSSAYAITTIKYSKQSGIQDNSSWSTPRTFLKTFPNPSKGSVNINYMVPFVTPISISIYDVTGRIVRSLTPSISEPGLHTTRWDGRDRHGNTMSSGVYYIKYTIGATTMVDKVLIVK